MPGPCSLPDGPKSDWEWNNELVCEVHRKCWPDNPAKGDFHRFVTVRMWRIDRDRHVTGKTK